uniref:Fibulin C-terminal Ig-like domain-containing protein n=1 Tax=Ditylenchus dipsaci TaxID=166011 RepID=A0A915ESB2_9BILA
MHISWQHIAIPKQVNISSQRPSVILFSMKGPTNLTSTMQFELRHVYSKPEASNVVLATRGNFLLQKGEEHNSAVIALRDSLDGPKNRVDDGYSCIRQCFHYDHKCLANYTVEILYQFRAIASVQNLANPIEISRITTYPPASYSNQRDGQFLVEYVIDKSADDKFTVEQNRNTGIVKLTKSIKGPKLEYIHVGINTKSRRRVLVAQNLAIIQVNVSDNTF